jgi:predicted DNA-binding transcriptional regulator YafY
MRADRLVAILLMLQQRGQVTAAEVARELEVSERTARRDLDALGVAGLPVYSQQGRNGGWRLAGGGRTDLSGLSAAEARALFLVAGPSSSTTPELRAALRKLVRALPEPFRDAAETAASAIVVDRTGWDGDRMPPRTTPRHLDAVQQAVVDCEQVRLGYTARTREQTERLVEPLGLATKGEVWYLVGDTERGLRTFRVDRITSIEPTGRAATRPVGFDLGDAWKLISDEVDRIRLPFVATARVDPSMLTSLRWTFGSRLRIGPPSADGWIEVEVRGFRSEVLAAELAGWSASVEVVEPPELRAHLGQIGRVLLARYGADTS